jgi:nucleotide-binding universal stress UspA family protein
LALPISPEKQKILVAVGISDRTLDTVRYVSQVWPLQNIEVVLFHVLRTVPEEFWDYQREDRFPEQVQAIKAWAAKQQKAAEEFMDEVRQVLLDAGMPSEAVTVNIHEMETDVPEDLILESQRGYSAVVGGRYEESKLKEIVLGRVATRLIERLTQTCVVMIGENPRPGKILIALDGSDNSMHIVDYVGTMLYGSNVEVLLFNAIQTSGFFQKAEAVEEWLAEGKKRIAPTFEKAKHRLVKAGFDPDRITTLVKETSNRANAIVEEAEKDGYGTIVMGRRGRSRVPDFLLGRVSNKVLHLAKKMAVWVVGKETALAVGDPLMFP